MNKIGIITTNFGRIPILEICFAGIDRLRLDTGMEIPCVCVGEEDDATVELCKFYDIEHIYQENRPLTAKFNTACKALEGRVEYVMILGSDNLISTGTFNTILSECEKGVDLVGLSDIYFYGMDDIHTGKLLHFSHTTVLGVGRTIKASVLDELNWKPWITDRDRAIDVIMLDAVSPYVNSRTLLYGQFAVDLKSSFNLNGIRFWADKLGYMPSDQKLWDNIGAKETELIKKYTATH
jgi:glycosyltransferase involved in cell wall biosynthesis